MSRFVLKPNLPEAADALLIGEKYAGLLSNSLNSWGITPIFVPDNPFVDPRLSGHADLSVLHAGGERLYLAPYLKGSALSEKLTGMGAQLFFPEFQQSPIYPGDARLNMCLVGKHLFCNRRVAESTIVESFTSAEEHELTHSRQGYARCSMCVIGERTVICADQGLFKAAADAGLDALLIEPGHITLDGFDYGFIGGASFKLSRHILAFTGRLDDHPSQARILAFLDTHEVEPVYITDLPVFDIGSAIPLIEKQIP